MYVYEQRVITVPGSDTFYHREKVIYRYDIPHLESNTCMLHV